MTRPAVADPGRDSRPRTRRGDVQGLRAIAVLLVIACHAGLPYLPGGFVGVDVFFVISGFLIAQLLYREVQRTGTVSLRDFYARRARRILPAATVVLVITMGAALALLSVVEALEVATDGAWAAFFAANLRFAAVESDYFAQGQGVSPLQHYWSLAVEEQFYLAWPVLLFACLLLRRANRRLPAVRRRRLPKVTVFFLLVVVTVGSFGYGVWLTAADPVVAYYSTPARAWELAFGALTGLVAHHVSARIGSFDRGLLCATGLTVIGVAAALFDDTKDFPGVAALAPVLGSALVLLAGAGGHRRQPLPVRALSILPLRVVGDWSYSLYLWHWPLLVLAERHLGGLTPRETAVAVGATFVLAGLTYRLVETPFRNPVRMPRRRALTLYPVSVGLVATSYVVAVGYSQWQAGEFGDEPAITLANVRVEEEGEPGAKPVQDPTVALVQASVVAARNGRAVPSDLTPDLLRVQDDIPDVGDCDYGKDVRKMCPRGDADADRSIVVLGNSHGRMWIPAFEDIAGRTGYRTYYLVKPQCTATLVTVAEPGSNGERWQACTEFREWALDQVAGLRPDLVVVSTSGPGTAVLDQDGEAMPLGPQRDAAIEQGYRQLFDRLRPLAERVVLLKDVPITDADPIDCLTKGSPDLGDCLSTPDAQGRQEAQLSVEAAEAAGVDHLDPARWVCWEGRCPVVIGDLLPYRDQGHLTATYAATLADELGAALGLLPSASPSTTTTSS